MCSSNVCLQNINNMASYVFTTMSLKTQNIANTCDPLMTLSLPNTVVK